jgi:hypothetical protein
MLYNGIVTTPALRSFLISRPLIKSRGHTGLSTGKIYVGGGGVKRLGGVWGGGVSGYFQYSTLIHTLWSVDSADDNSVAAVSLIVRYRVSPQCAKIFALHYKLTVKQKSRLICSTHTYVRICNVQYVRSVCVKHDL